MVLWHSKNDSSRRDPEVACVTPQKALSLAVRACNSNRVTSPLELKPSQIVYLVQVKERTLIGNHFATMCGSRVAKLLQRSRLRQYCCVDDVELSRFSRKFYLKNMTLSSYLRQDLRRGFT
jgi:hypothetical protein